jgi:hypothetical protein
MIDTTRYMDLDLFLNYPHLEPFLNSERGREWYGHEGRARS